LFTVDGLLTLLEPCCFTKLVAVQNDAWYIDLCIALNNDESRSLGKEAILMFFWINTSMVEYLLWPCACYALCKW